MKGYITILKVLISFAFLLTTNLKAQCINTYPNTETFEAAPTWTSGGANNDWAWGTPAHPTINTAGGGTKSWCVGGLTGSSYAFSEQCWIQSPCYNFSTLNYPWVSFKIFWECERQWDGMVLQYSINSGATWINVGAFGDAPDCNTANWYNYGNITWLTSIPTKHGWSGRIGATAGSCTGGFGSGGWLTAKHCLVGLANQPNVIFRFLMGSGTTCNSYDGEAIDDFTISEGMPHASTFSVNCNNFTAINPPCPTVSTYTWNFGDPLSGPSNVSNIANPTHIFSGPGIYSVTLSVSGGQCNPPGSYTQTVSVSNFAIPPVSQSVTCFGGSNGSGTVSVTGAAPFTYTWSPTGGNSSTASGLTAGTYSVQIKDGNNCIVTKTISIIQPPILSATIIKTNVTCNGSNNGSATLTAAGGTPGYTYTWAPSGGNAAIASGLGLGTYTVTVKDINGCSITAATIITQPPSLTAAITSTNATCGSTNGSAAVTVGGGTPGYTYSWSPFGGTGSTASGLAAGSYTVIVKDINNCTITAVAVISQPVSMTTTISSTNLPCNSSATGSSTVNIGGGTGPFTYTWSPAPGGGQGTSNVSGLTAGSYSVVIKDALNCTVTAVATITQPSALTTAITSTNVTCNGATNGIASVTAGGGTPGYTYSWSPSGGTGSIASGLAAGSYTVTVKDVNNCTITSVAVVNQPVAMSTTVNVSNVKCFGGATGASTINVSGGSAPYSYTWSPAPGAGQGTSNVSGLIAGTYTIIISDVNSCSISATAIITQPSALTTAITSTNVACNGATNGIASVTVGGGTSGYTYNWTSSGGTAATAAGLTAGSYTVTVKDVNNCTITAVANITQPTALTAITTTTLATCGLSNGSAAVTAGGGTPGYTYNWLPTGGTGATANGLAAGSYTVTVKDVNNCAVTAVAMVNQPIVITTTVNINNVKCFGGATGASTINVSGGSAPYSYTWSPAPGAGQGTSNVSGLTAGTYTVIVKDANNCGVSATAIITQPGAITTTINTNNVTCNGGSNGVINSVTGGGTPGYAYSWSPTGGSAASANGLIAGNYTLTITDANNCTTSINSIITEPSALTIAITSTNVTCNGAANGVSSVTVGGGTAGYTYSWSPSGGSGISASALVAGGYTLTVKDINNCIINASVTITQPSALSAVITSTDATCNGAANGSASVIAGGGTPGYTFTWVPSGGSAASAGGLSAGSYSVTVMDINNCKIIAVGIITQPSKLGASILSTSTSCNAGTNGSSTVTATGGTSPYSYSWSPTGGIATIAGGLSAGTYSTTITDANNCSYVISTIINQPPPIIASANGIKLCYGQSGNLFGLASGGNSPYTFIWNGIAGPSPTSVSSSVTTIYTLTVIDANGCSSSADTALINVSPALSVSVSPNYTICPGVSKALTANASGGNGNYNYLWLPGNLTGQSITVSPSASQNYTVIVSDGCSVPNAQANTAIIIAGTPPSVILANAPKGCTPLCVSFTCQTTPGATVNWIMGDGSYTNGNINSNACYQSPGVYTITSTVIDANGCQNTTTIYTVQVYPKPTADFNYNPYKPIVNEDADVHFTDASYGANITNWNWYFMNNASATSNLQNPVYVYKDAGQFVIALIVKSDYGCVDTTLKSILVGEDFGIYVPNAFTVNGDGVNDRFYAKGYGITKFEMNIFDRWGEKLFTSNDIQDAWDGTYQNRGNKEVKEDIYTWVINVTNVFGKAKEFTGHVTLIK